MACETGAWGDDGSMEEGEFGVKAEGSVGKGPGVQIEGHGLPLP